MTSTLSHALRLTHPAAYEELEATPEADILARAGELLIRDGWCQDRGKDEQGRRCVTLAIADAATELRFSVDLGMAAVEIVADALAERGWYELAERWNDQPERSLDDVLDVLAAARALLSGCSAAVKR